MTQRGLVTLADQRRGPATDRAATLSQIWARVVGPVRGPATGEGRRPLPDSSGPAWRPPLGRRRHPIGDGAAATSRRPAHPLGFAKSEVCVRSPAIIAAFTRQTMWSRQSAAVETMPPSPKLFWWLSSSEVVGRPSGLSSCSSYRVDSRYEFCSFASSSLYRLHVLRLMHKPVAMEQWLRV
ncbi:hypothetical protein NL676_039825 [Syzygium grande]|nr:hypothetical protein NL676_039825 [Syzygium grande]